MTSGDYDLHTLAGAYVLDAISPQERARFAAHLADCAECHREIAELREATARLGTAVAVRPRPELRGETINAACQLSQLPPVVDKTTRAGAGPAQPARRALLAGWRKLALAAAVAVIAGAAGLGWAANHAMQQLRHTQRQDHLIAAVLSASDATMLTAKVSGGGTAIVVLSDHEHMGVFTAHDLRALPATETYQLWLMGPQGARPAGMLKMTHGGMAGPAVVADMRPGDMIGLTIEPAGGSARPTTSTLVLVGRNGR